MASKKAKPRKVAKKANPETEEAKARSAEKSESSDSPPSSDSSPPASDPGTKASTKDDDESAVAAKSTPPPKTEAKTAAADEDDAEPPSAKPEAVKKQAPAKPKKAEPVAKAEPAAKTETKKTAKKDQKEPAKHSSKSKAGDDHGPEGENIRLGDLSGTLLKVGGGLAVVGLGGAAALGAQQADGFTQFFHSYLVAFWWGLSITLGALFFVMVQHLTKARWSPVVRRVAEILAANMPVLAILALVIIVPVLMGNTALYEWNDPKIVHGDHLLEHKEPYLNKTFFGIRWAVYFAIWIGLSLTLLKRSVAQDQSGEPGISNGSFVMSAPGMLLFALSLTFAAIDTIMSLEAKWFSTMFGVYVFAGAQLSFHAVLALSLFWLQKGGRLTKSVSVHHFHDIGKMMFAFVVFWAYIAFSQFMLIWYADIPEETYWYKPRFVEGWVTISIIQLVGHFVIPFFGLVSRHVKRHRLGLGFWAVYILVVHYIDLYWLIMPSFDAEKAPWHAMDALALVGVAGALIAGAGRTAASLNLRPTKDPRLAKSLAFENF